MKESKGFGEKRDFEGQGSRPRIAKQTEPLFFDGQNTDLSVFASGDKKLVTAHEFQIGA